MVQDSAFTAQLDAIQEDITSLSQVLHKKDVSESSTVGEILELPKIKNVLDSITHKIIIGVNGEILDGTFKPEPTGISVPV